LAKAFCLQQELKNDGWGEERLPKLPKSPELPRLKIAVIANIARDRKPKNLYRG